MAQEYYDERVAFWKDSPVGSYDEYIKAVEFLNDPDFTFEKAKSAFSTGGMLEKGTISALFDSIYDSFPKRSKFGIYDVAEFFNEPESGLVTECLSKSNLDALVKSDIKCN